MTDATKPLGTLQVDVDDLWVYYESIGRSDAARRRACRVHPGHPAAARPVRPVRRPGHVLRVRPRPAGAARNASRDGAAGPRGGEPFGRAPQRLRPAEPARRCAGRARGARQDRRRRPGQRRSASRRRASATTPHLPEVLGELGYLYDSSRLPTFYAPASGRCSGVLSRGEVDPHPLWALRLRVRAAAAHTALDGRSGPAGGARNDRAHARARPCTAPSC